MLKNLFSKDVDFLAIGDTAIDAFIKIKEARVNCDINDQNCMISMKFGDKVPFEDVYEVVAVGNSANAAVSVSKLGISSALVTDLGDDENGKRCIVELEKNKVKTNYISRHEENKTNYHYVLWYEAERTILVKHEEYDYKLPEIKKPKWVYISSLGSNSENYHKEIISWLKENSEIKVTFQPGTFQMKAGIERMAELYKRSEVFVVNVEESQRILNTDEKDVKVLMKKLVDLGPKIVCVTDGPKGAYMFDGTDSYFMPIYPDPKTPFERTGCGDAFASTFTAMLLLGKTPLQALELAPINPMSVVQYVGAQKGLLTMEQLEKFYKNKPEHYKAGKI